MQSIDGCSSNDRACEHSESQYDRSIHGVSPFGCLYAYTALVAPAMVLVGGRGGQGFHCRDSDAITRPTIPAMNCFSYELGGSGKRIVGEPTTPPFGVATSTPSEAIQVRAFDTSATSWRITTSFGSSGLRKTRPFEIPAARRLFSRAS